MPFESFEERLIEQRARGEQEIAPVKVAVGVPDGVNFCALLGPLRGDPLSRRGEPLL